MLIASLTTVTCFPIRQWGSSKAIIGLLLASFSVLSCGEGDVGMPLPETEGGYTPNNELTDEEQLAGQEAAKKAAKKAKAKKEFEDRMVARINFVKTPAAWAPLWEELRKELKEHFPPPPPWVTQKAGEGDKKSQQTGPADGKISDYKGYYRILGVDVRAPREEISRAYRRLAREWHVDKASTLSEEKQKIRGEMFKYLAEAASTLRDKDKRAIYDKGYGAEVACGEERAAHQGIANAKAIYEKRKSLHKGTCTSSLFENEHEEKIAEEWREEEVRWKQFFIRNGEKVTREKARGELRSADHYAEITP